MTSSLANSLLWLLASLGLFLVVQRWLHQEIQLLFYILTRRLNLALTLFALLFLPGVLLHEASHFVVAKLLQVRTHRFSLIPQVTVKARLRLGYVETAQTDVFRDTLIGAAPLVVGGAVVAAMGINQLGIAPLFDLAAASKWEQVGSALAALPDLPDFWLWFYLAFTISSMMLPSPSDRRAWLPVVLVVGLLAGLALLAGAGEWMTMNLAPGLESVVHSLATVFGIGLVLHLALGLPVAFLRIAMTRMVG
ncbi:MAG TPA: hypothetical protein VMS73_00675 [Anaerolineaceae bacterium]|nr:hypothetical protein [Anaerolineaceae bacterium]